MRNFLLFLSIISILSSCSKEQDIPFIPSISDTISPNFYHDLEGTYNGTISKVRINPPTQPGEISLTFLGPSLKHELNVTNIDFSNIAMDDISKLEDVGAQGAIQRIDASARLAFEKGTMDSTLYPINLFTINYGTFIDSFNGNWTSHDSTIVYFIRQISGNDSSDYFFEGTKL